MPDFVFYGSRVLARSNEIQTRPQVLFSGCGLALGDALLLSDARYHVSQDETMGYRVRNKEMEWWCLKSSMKSVAGHAARDLVRRDHHEQLRMTKRLSQGYSPSRSLYVISRSSTSLMSRWWVSYIIARNNIRRVITAIVRWRSERGHGLLSYRMRAWRLSVCGVICWVHNREHWVGGVGAV